ncbi:hypothetical protein JGI4_02175 [Candidatus Kryptonium thompsonii]|uniref:Uncharacterized protein n=1 Tax=Candidatus Kryptonium thompsonii TaxID=1633631 RepID=A0A0S4NEC3_9BACT|nr:hypothetical protein JGI4_02175 [Candidatus Kryptonium thompsoni]
MIETTFRVIPKDRKGNKINESFIELTLDLNHSSLTLPSKSSAIFSA